MISSQALETLEIEKGDIGGVQRGQVVLRDSRSPRPGMVLWDLEGGAGPRVGKTKETRPKDPRMETGAEEERHRGEVGSFLDRRLLACQAASCLYLPANLPFCHL